MRWDTKKLDSLVKISKGKKCSENESGEVRYIQIKDLRNDEILKYATLTDKIVPSQKEDILIAWDGANAGTIGYGLEGAIGSTIAKLSPKENFHTPFVGRFLQSKFSYLRANCTGATIPHISRSVLLGLQIPIPELAVQKQISEILDTADAVRQKTQQQLEALDELAKSVFGEMFGDLGKNSKNWTDELIDDLVLGIVGGTSYGGEERTLNEDELGVLKISAVTSGEFRPIFKAVKKNVLKKELVTPKEGDILFSRANTRELVAATCIVDKDYDWLFLPDKLWRIDLKKNKVNNYFFQFVLSDKKYRNKLTKKATGTSGSMLNISKKKLRNTLFPVPPLKLQDQFSEIIKNINRQKQKVKEALKESEDLFNALLQEVFQ